MANPQPIPSELPAELGRYTLLERIGHGGMAEVYRARLRGVHGVEKIVALKRILPDATRNPHFMKLFVREARISTRLEHPNLIQVFEFGQDEGELFLAMELVEGCDLRRVIASHRALGKCVPQELAICVILGVLQGLEFAHRLADENGEPLHVVHRDLSPANVLLSYAGAVKVADFGVAHCEDTERSDANLLKGKVSYMAPEQLSGAQVDSRVDVFAAACVLFEMLAGEPVYGGPVTPHLVRRVATGDVPNLEIALAHVDRGLTQVIGRALARDRTARTPSCEHFAQELRELIEQGRVPCAGPSELALYLEVLVPRERAPSPLLAISPGATVASPQPPPLVGELVLEEVEAQPEESEPPAREVSNVIELRTGDLLAEELFGDSVAPPPREISEPKARVLQLTSLPRVEVFRPIPELPFARVRAAFLVLLAAALVSLWVNLRPIAARPPVVPEPELAISDVVAGEFAPPSALRLSAPTLQLALPTITSSTAAPISRKPTHRKTIVHATWNQ